MESWMEKKLLKGMMMVAMLILNTINQIWCLTGHVPIVVSHTRLKKSLERQERFDSQNWGQKVRIVGLKENVDSMH